MAGERTPSWPPAREVPETVVRPPAARREDHHEPALTVLSRSTPRCPSLPGRGRGRSGRQPERRARPPGGQRREAVETRRRAISNKVFVGNLSFQTGKDELVRLLSDAGQVVDAYLPTDRQTGRPRGFAFVTFSTDTEAAEAIRRFHDRELDGRKLVVNEADARPPRRPDAFAAPRGPSAPPPPDFFSDRDRPSSGRPFKAKGSRRGLRRRKRSL